MVTPWHTTGIPTAIARVVQANSLLVVLTTHVPRADDEKSTGDGGLLASKSSRALEERTFTAPEVMASIQRHGAVCLRISGDREDADFKNFSALFPVNQTPCVHIVAPDGRVLLERAFYISPKALVRALEFAAKKRDSPPNAPPVSEPNLGAVLHSPKPLSESVLAKLKATSDAIAKAKAAAAVKAKSVPAAKPRSSAPVPADIPSSSTVTSSSSSVERALPASRGALQLGDRARLQLRLPDGTSAVRSFSAGTPLREVSAWAAEQIGGSVDAVQLSVAFPRRVFDGGDEAKTLRELELVPSASLIVTASSGPGVQQSGSGVMAAVSAGGGLLRGAVGVAGSFLGSFVGSAPQPNAPDGSEQGGGAADQHGQGRNERS